MEATILTKSTSNLIGQVFDMKSQAKQNNVDQTLRTSVTLKLAYVTGSESLIVEVVNVHNITPREKKSSSNIQLYLRLSPDMVGMCHPAQKTAVFKDIERSIIFDLQDQAVHFNFKIGQS